VLGNWVARSEAVIFLLSPFAPRKNASIADFCGAKDDDVLYLANKITVTQSDSDGRGNCGIDFWRLTRPVYLRACPPSGHGTHGTRYFEQAMLSYAGFNASRHLLFNFSLTFAKSFKLILHSGVGSG